MQKRYEKHSKMNIDLLREKGFEEQRTEIGTRYSCSIKMRVDLNLSRINSNFSIIERNHRSIN